jgi:hypothetical protein
MAMVKTAIDVQSELPSASWHGVRAALARQALANPSVWTGPFAQAVASQGFDNSSADKQISDSVSSVWNAIAGAS